MGRVRRIGESVAEAPPIYDALPLLWGSHNTVTARRPP